MYKLTLMNHTLPISMHARTHTQHKRPKRSNRNWKQNPCAPQNLPNFSLQASSSSSSFTSTGQSIFSCCWRSQVRSCAAAINAPCPTGDYRHRRVSQQPSIAKKTTPSNYGKRLPEPPKSNKKEKKLNKESVRCLQVVSPKPAFACKQAPAQLSTRHQPVLDGHARRHRQHHTSTPVHTNFAWFQSYSTRNLRTRSGHPPEVASQLMHP